MAPNSGESKSKGMFTALTLMKLLFALGLSFIATFQNGTNAFGPNYPTRLRPSHPGFSLTTPSSTALGVNPLSDEEDNDEPLSNNFIGDSGVLSTAFSDYLSTVWNEKIQQLEGYDGIIIRLEKKGASKYVIAAYKEVLRELKALDTEDTLANNNKYVSLVIFLRENITGLISGLEQGDDQIEQYEELKNILSLGKGDD